jgi:leucyl/phenylalanyl-tRNA---protein transferase
MPIYLLDETIWFPEQSEYDSDVIAVGGDLSTERILTAYSMGIFPWYNIPGEIQWWCPLDRCVLLAKDYKPSHSMRNLLNKNKFEITTNRCFLEVVEACREGKRAGQTWIHDEVVESFKILHEKGFAHSIEVWQEGKLVGGLYGLQMGHVFFGESMFSRVSNASKVAFHHLAMKWKERNWPLIDCQVYNEHLASLGAVTIQRHVFLRMLAVELKFPMTPFEQLCGMMAEPSSPEVLLNDLRLRLGQKAGLTAHHKVMSYARQSAEQAKSLQPPPKQSAVMMLLFPQNNLWHTAFMLRPEKQGVHSNQLSFPGGKWEESDHSLMHTAIRETFEEVGVEVSHNWIAGELTQVYIPPSHFLVQPYVAVLPEAPRFTINPDEVRELLIHPISFFLSPGRVEEKEMILPTTQQSVKIPTFNVQGKVLWGATAMMVQEFRMLFGVED